MSQNLHETQKKEREKAVIFGVISNQEQDIDFEMEELESLAKSADLEIVASNWQNVRSVNPATYIGRGKVEELQQTVQDTDADVVVIDCELSGSQVKNLSEELNTKVIDRTMLILDIFAKRATTNEGKLQVELAQAKYLLPRLSRISGTSGRFGARGVGSRGPGETKLELHRRKLLHTITNLEKELKLVTKNRSTKTKQRKSTDKANVAIVGYTNAGKSTLLNLISKADIYADDKLFATLETTSRTVWLDLGKEIILTDTVGFVSKLPHSLVHSFKSTLEEAKNADIILHVVDASNKDRDEQIAVVKKVLEEIGANGLEIMVYNKTDKIHALPPKDKNIVSISAKENRGIDELKKRILQAMKQLGLGKDYY